MNIKQKVVDSLAKKLNAEHKRNASAIQSNKRQMAKLVEAQTILKREQAELANLIRQFTNKELITRST